MLTDENGNPLNFQAISGNSGPEYTNLNAGAVVTLILQIPSGQTSAQFYAKTQEDGNFRSQGTTAYTINLIPNGTGILSLATIGANLSPSESRVALLYTNKGTANVTGIDVGTATAPLSIESNTCSKSLTPNSSCTVVLKSNAGVGTSGTGSFITNSTGGNPLVMNYNYVGVDPESGFALQAVNNFNFKANTVNTSEATLVTLTSLSTNTKESDFDFTLPTHFTMSAGTGNDSCVVSGNKVTSELQANTSCNFTLTYTNTSATASSLGNVTVNYKYHGDRAGTGTKSLTYETEQSKANLSFTPLSHDFGTIIANNRESASFIYTLNNAGPDVATNIVPTINAPFSVSDNKCAGVNLASGSTCTVTVKFGPTNITSSNQSLELSTSYKSATNSSVNETTIATAIGTVRAPVSASPEITNVVFGPEASGGTGLNSGSAFAVARSTVQTVTLTYKNKGNADAHGFTVSTTNPNGYTYDANGSTCSSASTLQKNSGNSCTMKYTMDTSSAVARNLEMSSVNASWTTVEEENSSNRPLIWTGNNSSTIWASVYELEYVVASLWNNDTEQEVTAPYKIEAGEKISVVFELHGGYNVQPIKFTAINYDGYTTDSDNCQVSSSKTNCSINFTAPNSVTNSSLISFASSAAPSIPAQFNIEVLPRTMWLFVSNYSVNGKMQVPNADWQTQKNGGINAADEICRKTVEMNKQDFKCKNCANSTWKAMIVQTNVREAKPNTIDWVYLPNTPYRDAFNSSKIGTTNQSATFNFNLDNTFGGGGNYFFPGGNLYIWTGLKADWTTWGEFDTCRNWTSDSYNDVGAQGYPIYSDGLNLYLQDKTAAAIFWPSYQTHKCDDSGYNAGSGKKWATSIVCVEQQ